MSQEYNNPAVKDVKVLNLARENSVSHFSISIICKVMKNSLSGCVPFIKNHMYDSL